MKNINDHFINNSQHLREGSKKKANEKGQTLGCLHT